MTTGYLISGGADLSTVFASGTTTTATGYKVSGGADLNTLFAPLSAGSAAAATGYKISGGADLNTVFAAFGTLGYFGTFNTGTGQSSGVFLYVAGNGSGTYVAYNASNGIIYYSSNGSSWTGVTPTNLTLAYTIDYANGYFVSGQTSGGLYSWYSTSPTTSGSWTVTTMNGTGSSAVQSWGGVAYKSSGTTYLSVNTNASNALIAQTSTAPTTASSWTNNTISSAASYKLPPHAVVWTGTYFVVLMYTGTNPYSIYVAYSTSGTGSWTVSSALFSSPAAPSRGPIVAGSSIVIAIPTGNTSGTTMNVAVSTTGVSSGAPSFSASTVTATGLDGGINFLGYDGTNYFVSCNNGSSTIAYASSITSSSWTNQSTPSNIEDLARNGTTQYVFAGSSNLYYAT